MTVVTASVAMAGLERVIGILIVIEGGFVPAFFLVTACAFLAKPVCMHVPDSMTADTLLWRILVLAANVTGIAVYFFVRIQQFKIGFVVIKSGFPPA